MKIELGKLKKLPDDFSLREEIDDLKKWAGEEVKARPSESFDWKSLPKPVLIVFIVFCVSTITSLGTTVLNLQKTSLDEIRADTRKNKEEIEFIKSDIVSLKSGWAYWTANVQRTENKVDALSRKIDEYQEEQLRTFRAAARSRGDDREDARLTKKIGEIVAKKGDN